MFYSQTFLARKGPLGTVWCAAHLQHKLRKTHYTSTDIPSTVDRIMFPEVPIALRMSSHLLLGVVRIYSKKVDYLYKDCNLVLVTLKKAFVHTDVDLPPNATQAQFNAVTLPETYQLDALDIDDILSSDPYQDSHVSTQDEITLTDETDNRSLMGYVAITFDDDIMQEESPEPTNEGVAATDEGIVIQPHDGEGDQEPIPSNTSPNRPVVDDDPAMPNIDNMNETDNTSNVGIASHDNEEMEIMRDAVGDPNPLLVPELLDFQQTSVSSPVRHSEQIIRDKETPTLSEENVSVQQQSPLFEPFSSGAMETPDPFQLNPSPVYNSPALELQPTPQPQPQPQAGRPRGSKRKQKQPFDKSTVLSNKVMNDRIVDCSDIVKKRRKLPCSSSDTFRFNNRKMKEQVFLEPLISGLSSHIISMSGKDFFVSNPNLVLSEETDQVPLTTQVVSEEEPHQDIRTEQPSNVAEDLQREGADEHTRSEQLNDPIEQLRDETRHHEHSLITDLVPPSPRIGSPLSHHNLNTPPLSPGTAFQSMQDLGTSSTPRSKQATPVRNIEADLYSGSACPSHIPAFMASADDELAFLEMDSHSPADSQRSQGSGTLTARTRAVAQYLRGQSPLSSSPIDQHGDRQLSLNAILQGRSRKMCARMIFETLVLCNYGLINVEQEEPKEADEVYGDIKLRLTSQVSKGQF